MSTLLQRPEARITVSARVTGVWGKDKRGAAAASINIGAAVLGEGRVAEDRVLIKDEAHREEDPRGGSIPG